jgi:hypothetical protein
MNALFEQLVAQNTGLTTFAIAQAVIRFDQQVNSAIGLDLFAALLVPPLVFHRRTADRLANKQMTEGLFFRTVAEDRELVLGIQDRFMATAAESFIAIHLGCSVKLFRLTQEQRPQLFPLTKSLPREIDGPETIDSVRGILAAAKRLGYCFATTDLSVICSALRVRF